jgi:hypothetical protein
VADQYLAYLTNPKSQQVAREHLEWFQAYIGKQMKVSALRVHHVNDKIADRQKKAPATKS